MHRIHGGLTVVAPITGNSKKLSALLQLLNVNGDLSVFHKSATTLFVAGVILPQQDYNGTKGDLPESLVFATSYCGPLSTHLNDLWETNSATLLSIFSYCKNFPLVPDKDNIISFLKTHSHTGSFTSRFDLITKNEVQLEKKLRKEIERYIENAQALNAFDGLRKVEIKTLIYRHLQSQGNEYAWAFIPFKKNIRERLYTTLRKLLLIIIILPLIIILFVPLGVILLYINKGKNAPATRPDDARVRDITATQLNPVVNGMTAAAPLKKGRVRRYFYFFALKLIGLFYRAKVPTVSSIRWLSIDNKKRLLFLSNYSNTTDFYVRDFLIGSTPIGVNFMFSNGEGFPDATLSFLGGIRKYPEEYMNAVHTGQHVMDLWYTHESELAVDMINRNRTIRNGLVKRMDEDEATEWLRLF